MIRNHIDMCAEISNILIERLGVSKEKCSADYWDIPLTGFHFGLSGVEMAYVLLEIEKKFGIHVPKEELVNYGFCCISKIANSIERIQQK